MRRTTGAIAVVGALLFSGCSEGSAEPDTPDPGPLRLESAAASCQPPLADGIVRWRAHRLDNTADIPLTIDAVTLTGAVNISLVDAALVDDDLGTTEREQIPATDATLGAKGEPADDMLLLLGLKTKPGEELYRFAGVTVDYHNVDGRFRATDDTAMELSEACLP
jgi:hypothetical protein